ncbi:hypothetical protein TNCV_3396221 [Trichonephila clavipes]|nr:hypothetical protein TNCV_3396221 [Trichonephila clavipes]
MPNLLQKFRQASGTFVSITAIHKEAHLRGFHVHAATRKPLISKPIHAVLVSWCKGTKIGPKRTGNYFSRDINQCSISISWMAVSAFGICLLFGVYNGLTCQSSYVDPMENLCIELDLQIKRCNKRAKSVKELACLLQAE